MVGGEADAFRDADGAERAPQVCSPPARSGEEVIDAGDGVGIGYVFRANEGDGAGDEDVADGGWERGECRAVQGDGIVLLLNGLGPGAIRLRAQVGQRRFDIGGGAGDGLHGAGGDGGEGGDDLSADAVAGVAAVGVGEVEARLDGGGAEVGFDIATAECQQGADEVGTGIWSREGPGGAGADAGKPGEAGAAGETEEDGLRLVIGGVAEGDGIGSGRHGGFAQGGVAGVAERFFGAGAGAGFEDEEGDVQGGAECGDEGGIGMALRGGTEAVVDVGDGEGDLEGIAGARAQTGEEEEEGGGIGAAGDGDECVADVMEEGAIMDGGEDAAFQGA